MIPILTAIGFIVLLVVWEKVWKPTLLDTTRDSLFDIRDEAREWFLKEGYGLAHPMYLNLRSMLNCHLRHTEKVSITNYIVYCIVRARHPQEDARLEKEIKERFKTDDMKLYTYIEAVRKSAGDVMLLHMVKRSMVVTLAIMMTALVHIVVYALRSVFLFIKNSLTPAPRYNVAFASIMMWIIAAIPGGYTSNIRVEKYSFSQASPVCRTNEARQHC